MTRKDFNKDELRYFTGSEQWYRHALVKSVIYTDGIHYLAENAGAYWLIDEIALAQRALHKLPEQYLQVWKLTVKNNSAILNCVGDNETILFRKEISFTDFPLDEITLYVCNGTILLPSEY